MGKALGSKLKEAILSVLPVTLIVLVISFTPLVKVEPAEMVIFAFRPVHDHNDDS